MPGIERASDIAWEKGIQRCFLNAEDLSNNLDFLKDSKLNPVDNAFDIVCVKLSFGGLPILYYDLKSSSNFLEGVTLTCSSSTTGNSPFPIVSGSDSFSPSSDGVNHF
jgi:hypothetical protein